MLFNDDEQMDYRGRGKRATSRYKGRHSKSPARTEQFVALDEDALVARVGASPGIVAEDDPFAPQPEPQLEPASLISQVTAEEPPASDNYVEASSSSPEVAAEKAPEPQQPIGSHSAGNIPALVNDDAAALAAAPVVGAHSKPSGTQPAPTVAPDPDPDAKVAPVDDPFAPSDDAASAEERVSASEVAQYDRSDARYTKHKMGFSRGQKIALAVVAIVAALVFAAAGVAFAMWQNTQSNIELQDQTIKEELAPVVEVEDPYWTLILGSDSRTTDTKGTNADVILLARIDQPNKKVTLVSIPRDTRVNIDGSYTKINSAYSLGGAKQAIQTVEEFSGIEVSHYVEVYFKGFSKLVDKLGGITVDVPERASYNGVTIEPGLQTLNGKEALTLARNRKTYESGDFRRTECQRLLVQALAVKILSEDATQLPGTIESISKCFSTDMPLGDVVKLAVSMQGLQSDDIRMSMAPSWAGMLDEVSYTFTYINQWKLMMQRANTGDNPKLTKREKEICGEYSTYDADMDMSTGLPEDIAAELQNYWDEKATKKKEKQQQSELDGTNAVTDAEDEPADDVMKAVDGKIVPQ